MTYLVNGKRILIIPSVKIELNTYIVKIQAIKMAYNISSNDLFRFSPTAPDSGDENSDQDNLMLGHEMASDEDYLSSDELTGLGSSDRLEGHTIVEDQYGRTEHYRQEHTEMKEQMYQDKLSHLKRQLEQLNEGNLPDYTKKLRRLGTKYRERMRISEVIRDLEVDMVEQDYINEKRSAVREFEEQKVFLRDQLINELEEKQRMIETERHNMELTGDSMELKPINTRKLRRRPNEGQGSNAYGDKRGVGGNGGGRGTAAGKQPGSVNNLNYLLQDQEINEDLKIINKNRAYSSVNKSNSSNGSGSGVHSNSGSGVGGGVGSSSSAPMAAASSSTSGIGTYHRDSRIEEGKLFYEKRWFRRGQSVQVEGTKGERFPAMISAIGGDAIWVRKLNDNTKLRIYLSQLNKGKYTLKRRAV